MSEIPDGDTLDFIKECCTHLVAVFNILPAIVERGAMDEHVLNLVAALYLHASCMLESTVFDDEDDDGSQSAKRYGAVAVARLQGEVARFTALTT